MVWWCRARLFRVLVTGTGTFSIRSRACEVREVPRGRKKQKQLNGNSQLTAFVFLDHPVAIAIS